jgi:uncharacterized membrane protein
LFAKVGFYAGLFVATAVVVLLIQSLPTLFDIMIVPAAVVGAALFGRLSPRWF